MAKARSIRARTSTAGLPAWVPPSLAAAYRDLDELLSHVSFAEEEDQDWHDTKRGVLHRLFSDRRMEGVWAALHVRRRMSEELMAELVKEVAGSVFTYDRMPRRTRSEQGDHVEEVRELIRQLRRKIARDLGRESARAGAYYWPRNLQGYIRAAELTEVQSRVVQRGVHRWLENEHRPTFDDLLEDLELAATASLNQKPRLAKPGSPAAKSSYVALDVVRFFEEKLKSPLHGHAATIASVVTGIDLDPEAVRKLCSRRARA